VRGSSGGLGQQDIGHDLSSDIIELMEIAHTLTPAETSLLTSDRAKAVEELERGSRFGLAFATAPATAAHRTER